MKERIVCHIGLHKTATGTLQRQFFPACRELQLFTTLQPHTRDFIHRITRCDPAYFNADEAGALLKPYLSVDSVNLISNESLSGPPYAGVIEHGLDHRTPVLQNLQSVYPDARVVIVLRRQDGLARSLYRQYLKRGGTARIDKFYGVGSDRRPALMPLDRFKYSNYIDTLKSMFPSGVQVMLFEEFVADKTHFLERLCDFIGVPMPAVDLTSENASRLGPVAMEVSRWMNFVFRSMLNRGPLPQIPRKQFGRWTFVSPIEYLHDYWPGNGKAGKRVNEVCATILDSVRTDNRTVDERNALGMSGHGYY